MIKRMIVMLAVVGVLLGGIIGYKGFLSGQMKKQIAIGGVPSVTVSTTKAAMAASDFGRHLRAAQG